MHVIRKHRGLQNDAVMNGWRFTEKRSDHKLTKQLGNNSRNNLDCKFDPKGMFLNFNATTNEIHDHYVN